MPENEARSNGVIRTGPVRTEVHGHIGRYLVEAPLEVHGSHVDGGVWERVDDDVQRMQALLQGDGLAHWVLESRQGEGRVFDEGVTGRCSLGGRQCQADDVAQAQERGAHAPCVSGSVQQVGWRPVGGAESSAVRFVDASLQRRQVHRTEENPGEDEVDVRHSERVQGPEAQ